MSRNLRPIDERWGPAGGEAALRRCPAGQGHTGAWTLMDPKLIDRHLAVIRCALKAAKVDAIVEEDTQDDVVYYIGDGPISIRLEEHTVYVLEKAVYHGATWERPPDVDVEEVGRYSTIQEAAAEAALAWVRDQIERALESEGPALDWDRPASPEEARR